MFLKKRILLFPLVLSLILSACSADSIIDKEISEQEEVNQLMMTTLPNELIFKQVSSPFTIDPTFATDLFSLSIHNNVFEGLFKQEKDGIKPALAENYTISSDNKVYTFTLKKDATWSNGDPVTAHDFVFSWKRAVDPKNGSPLSIFFSYLKNYSSVTTKDSVSYGNLDELGVRAIDDHTLEVTFEKAQAEHHIIRILSHPHYVPQPQKLHEKLGKNYGTSIDQIAFNGPFKIVRFTDREMILDKNERYWDKDNVKLDQITYHLLKPEEINNNQLIQEFNENKLTSFTLNEDQYEDLKHHHELTVTPSTTVSYFQFNQNNKQTLNEDIRKAISLSLDKEKINENAYEGANIPLTNLIPKSLIFSSRGEDFYTEDLITMDKEKAKKYFNSGLSILKKDEITLTIGAFSPSQTLEKVLAEMKLQLEENLPGLSVNIKRYSDINVYTSDISNGAIDLFYYKLRSSEHNANDYVSVFKSEHPVNLGKFSNIAYDSLIESLNNVVSEEEAREIQNQAEKILVKEEAVIIPMVQFNQYTLLQDFVKDLYQPAIGFPFYKYTYIEN